MPSRLLHAIVYGILVSWTIFPVVCVLVVIAISTIFGCQVNEGSPMPCLVFGVEIGKTLYTLGVMGWLGIVTLPTGGLALIVYTLLVFFWPRISGRGK
jgi:hypothetical protein